MSLTSVMCARLHRLSPVLYLFVWGEFDNQIHGISEVYKWRIHSVQTSLCMQETQETVCDISTQQHTFCYRVLQDGQWRL